jgi:hypothetical protein
MTESTVAVLGADQHGDKDMCATWFASAPDSLVA